MSTTWEQLEGAALSLARSGPIKDRLAEAYRNHLASVRVEDLPEIVRDEFRACRDALTHERPLRGEDAVRATVRKMSSSEADELACSVVRLFAAIVRETARTNGAAHNGVSLNGVSLTLESPRLNGISAARPKNGAPQAVAV